MIKEFFKKKIIQILFVTTILFNYQLLCVNEVKNTPSTDLLGYLIEKIMDSMNIALLATIDSCSEAIDFNNNNINQCNLALSKLLKKSFYLAHLLKINHPSDSIEILNILHIKQTMSFLEKFFVTKFEHALINNLISSSTKELYHPISLEVCSSAANLFLNCPWPELPEEPEE